MIEIKNTFSEHELKALKSLVGQEFKFIGGREVPDFLVSDSLVLGASNTALAFSAAMKDVTINGAIEEFSFLFVEVANEDVVAETLKSGNMFLLNLRHEITGISIVRETLTHFVKNLPSWTLSADVALVLHLVEGNVMLRLVSHSVEAIAVEYAHDFSLSSFEKPSSRFKNDLFDAYTSQFEVISVS